jgi:HD-GYP domain-containing protein (c-di-GMP phosphodiesterase class II)
MTERESLFYVVSDLALAIQGAFSYPENHPRVQELLVRLHRRVCAEAERCRGLNIGFFRDHVVVDEHPFLEPNPTMARLIERMQEKGIEKILISAGITYGELKRFVYFLGDGGSSAAEQRWESIVCGRVEGAAAADGVSLGSAPADRQSNILAGASAVLQEVLASLAGNGKGSRIEDGRDIVSSIMMGLRQEGMLIDRLIHLQCHDDYTVTHSLNVCILVVAQAVHGGLPERHIREIGLAALLHDIGKERISPGLLNKNGRLDAGEFEEVKKHPVLGAKLLRRMDCGTDLPMVVAFEHHIRYDRTGYPRARSSDPLHAASYLTQIADVYDALRTYRPYRPSTALDKTLSIMKQGRGTEFEPRLLDRFFDILAREEASAGPSPALERRS